MHGKRVLCVDDDPDTLRVRKLLLESRGYSVLTATSGEEALNLISPAASIDLVLLDYVMPGMKGDELAEKVRQRFPALPVVAVSGVEKLPDRLLRNVNASVPKGVAPERLLSEIAENLRKWGAREMNEPKSTVLCVEDDELELKARKKLFESAGFEVLEARSKSVALSIFRASRVDVVVLDYWLSGLEGTGTALAEEIKRISPTTPVLMLSGYGALPGEGALVDAWMSKSRVQPEDLIAEVKRFVEQRRQKKPQ